MARGIQHLGTQGLVYQTLPDGTTIENTWANIESEIPKVYDDGVGRAPIISKVASTGLITVTSSGGTGNITDITVNGVSQIGANIAVVSTDVTVVAGQIADAINNFTPASGPDFTAEVNAGVVTVFGPVDDGATPNGYAIVVSVDDVGIVTTTEDMTGGSDEEGIYSDKWGARYWLDADYGSEGCIGSETADPTSIANAIEITEHIVNRGFQNGIYPQTVTIADGKIDIQRVASIMMINVDTEGGAGTDDLENISTDGFGLNDIILLRGVDAGRVTTLKDGVGNIETEGDADFSTSGNTGVIWLQYNSDNKWYEIDRPGGIPPNVANHRAQGIPQGVVGVEQTDVPAGGGTVTLIPGTDKQIQQFNDTVTLTSGYTITDGGTPLPGETFIVDWRALVTLDGNTLTIFGIDIPEELALLGNFTVIGYYDDIDATFKSRLFVDFDSAGFILQGMLGTDAVQTANILDGEVTPAKLSAGVLFGNAQLVGEATQVGNDADTLEKDLSVYNLAANTLDINGNAIKITAFGSFAANNDTKTVRVYFGSSVVALNTDNTTPNNLLWSIEVIVWRVSSSVQKAKAIVTLDGESSEVQFNSPGESLGGALDIKVTGQSGTATANNIVKEATSIEHIKA